LPVAGKRCSGFLVNRITAVSVAFFAVAASIAAGPYAFPGK
jgi:hypothetical protein